MAEAFYFDIVDPLLKENYPELSYSCGLIGSGSEILGFDDEISTDHHWGPRLQIFLSDIDFNKYETELHNFFSYHIPSEFMGFPTHWTPPDPEDSGTQILQKHENGKINHRIEIFSLNNYLNDLLGISSHDLQFTDWLCIPEQKLLEFISGIIFRDDLGELSELRKKLKFYPDDVLRFKLIGCWDYISQESAFIGRTGDKGDDLGSRIITTRLVRMIIQMAYLLERKYPPYSKWLTHGFSLLPDIEELNNLLEKALITSNWREREDYLCEAILILIERQNKLNISKSMNLKPQQFHGRDIKVLNVEVVIKALWEEIDIKPKEELQFGGIDQFVDSSLILSNGGVAKKLAGFFDDLIT
ncbi:MAG: hypothetical protein HeimC3_33470 [Candidatus Heimdallarchaeota archaeon LC_3]|nr:MAG: hypothetical protein HeimC3_33470 [Candidatus Heimdallarchaeota archaeon LC_3]